MKTVPLRHPDHSENRIDDDPVDHIEPIPESQHITLASLMTRLVVWVGIGGSSDKIAARFMVLSVALGIDLGPKLITQADIAKATDLSREAISLMSNELRDQFGLTTYNNRNQENRNRCKKAHTKSA